MSGLAVVTRTRELLQIVALSGILNFADKIILNPGTEPMMSQATVENSQISMKGGFQDFEAGASQSYGGEQDSHVSKHDP